MAHLRVGDQHETREMKSLHIKGDDLTTSATSTLGDNEQEIVVISAPGTIGSTGASGATGPPGLDGAQGSTGATGVQGVPGLDGSVGATGPSGPQGFLGPAGVDGDDGDVGPQGPVGPIGAQGFTGAGVTGATGPQGPQGEDGDEGPRGVLGPVGSVGSTGASGPQGRPGDEGDDGDRGPIGPQGIQGITGPMGPAIRGSDGEDGDDGAPGPPGPPGAAGAAGSVGPAGPVLGIGIPGQDGDDGIDGSPGPVGPQGIQGNVGPAGAVLGIGVPGQDGDDGDGLWFPPGPLQPRSQLFRDPVLPSFADFVSSLKPATPPAAIGRLYVREIPLSGKEQLMMIDPAGQDWILQQYLGYGNRMSFRPAGGTTGTGINRDGIAWTSAGTVTTPAPSAGLSLSVARTRYANVVTTTNQQLGPRFNTTSEQIFWRGNAASQGGFWFFTRFRISAIAATTVRIFAGMQGASATGSVCISDTVINNVCGLWHDTTDALTKFSLVTRDATTTTKTDMTVANNIAAGNLYDFYMYCAPNGSTIYARLDDATNSTTVQTSTGTTLPVSTVFMSPQVQMSNGTANTSADTVAIEIASIDVHSFR